MLFLVDKSVLARQHLPSVAAVLLPRLAQLATCSTVLLEQGWSAKSTAHYAQIADTLSWWVQLPIDQSVLDLAVGLQAHLVEAGQHRGPGIPDLILAAVAITHTATLLHYDRDFELIGEVEPRLTQEWVVPRGSVD